MKQIRHARVYLSVHEKVLVRDMIRCEMNVALQCLRAVVCLEETFV